MKTIGDAFARDGFIYATNHGLSSEQIHRYACRDSTLFSHNSHNYNVQAIQHRPVCIRRCVRGGQGALRG